MSNDSWSLGLSYISQNFLNETTQKPDGSASFMGTSNYALDLGYEDSLASSWIWSGRIAYTPLARSSEGDTAEVRLLHLKFLAGQNFSGSSRSSGSWDWFAGVGLLSQEIKGKGGIAQLNNGTGSSPFAVPARTSVSRNGTQSVGVGYSANSSRVVFEVAFENLLDEQSRTQNLILSYLYTFGKAGSGSRSRR